MQEMDSQSQFPEMTIVSLPVDDIHNDELFNCRGVLNNSDIVPLASDIRDNGLLQPIVVVQRDSEDELTGKRYRYKIVAGHRRHRAFIILKYPTIPAIIKTFDGLIAERVANLNENLKRKDINIIQEARAIQDFIQLGMSSRDIGRKLGVSTAWVDQRRMLLDFEPDIQKQFVGGVLKIADIETIYYANRHRRDVFEGILKIRRDDNFNRVMQVKKTKINYKAVVAANTLKDKYGDKAKPMVDALLWFAGKLTIDDLAKYIVP